MLYQVFARAKRGDTLCNIGIVEAPSEELARIYATCVYDEENWAEMCIVDQESIRWVVKPKGLFAREVKVNG